MTAWEDMSDDAYDAAESRGEAYAEQLAEWADNERKRRRENPERYPAREENHAV